MAERLAGYDHGPEREARLRALRLDCVELGRTRERRPILAWTQRDQRSDPELPGVLLLSLVHPMEWIGFETNVALVRRWISEDSPLPPGTPVWTVPVVNPDGVARVEEALERGRPRWVRGNAARVDLNRNFPRDHRVRPKWLDFWPLYRSGPYPLSEPESRAVADMIAEKRIAISISLHSLGRWFFYPPSGRWSPGPETPRHAETARVAFRGLNQGLFAPYRHAQLGRWSPLFRAHGTEIDYLAAATGGLSYLVELSTGGIGRWGLRRLLQPVFGFNPPHPEREISRVTPLIEKLTRAAFDALPSSREGA